MSPLRTIKAIIPGVEQAKGVGATVRRSIGNMRMRNFTPFLLFDHFSSNGVGGFPEHPHLGQETITLMLKGAFAHEDFTGSKGVLREGDLQFMTAGRGTVHSEMPVIHPDGSLNVGLQLWVDLPEKLKEVEPRYRDLKSWEVPEAVEQDGKLKVKVISGKSYGVELDKELASTSSCMCCRAKTWFFRATPRFHNLRMCFSTQTETPLLVSILSPKVATSSLF